jgi:hypothetical protein
MAKMKLVSMERTEAEKKAYAEPTKAAQQGPDYPWGLCLHLGKDELKKLGLKDLPQVGDEFHIYAVATVRSVSQSSSDTGSDSRSVELQVTEMSPLQEDEGAPAANKAASKLYPSAEEA